MLQLLSKDYVSIGPHSRIKRELMLELFKGDSMINVFCMRKSDNNAKEIRELCQPIFYDG